MRVLVVGGGPPPLLSALPKTPFDLVIAVDSGFDHARGMGLAVDVLVGDATCGKLFGTCQPEHHMATAGALDERLLIGCLCRRCIASLQIKRSSQFMGRKW